MMLPIEQDFPLRPYQVESIQRLRLGLAAGHRAQILCAPTGSGKTVQAAHLVREALAKGSRVGFIADRRVLVQQTSERFTAMRIPHGVLMAGSSRLTGERAIICSAQTLERAKTWPKWSLAIVDECHSVRNATADYIRNAGIPIIGLSATPFTDGLAALYSNVVNAVTTNDLLKSVDPDTGAPYLTPLTVYAARAEIDMAGAGRDSAGEWAAIEVERRGAPIIGDAVIEWREKTGALFGGPVKTLVRSATIAHGAEICRAFQAAGYDFRQASYKSSDAEAERLVHGFKRGDFLGLVSVDKFNKGFDVPEIRCLIDQRPLRKSLASEVQFLGRGMRAAPGKDQVLLLDCTGNYLGFMAAIDDFFAHGVGVLSDKERSAVRADKKRMPTPCACGMVLPRGATVCPACGLERRRPARIEHAAGELRRVEPGHGAGAFPDKASTWRQILTIAAETRTDEDSVRRFALAQYRTLYGKWPMGLRTDGREEPTPELRAQVRRQSLAYWRKRRRRR